MDITIHFESSLRRRTVALHAWEPQGEVWDLTATADAPEGASSFTFRVTGAVTDQRTVQFKFRFPDEKHWEGDDLIRRVATRRAQEFWTFDVSSRVTTRDPAGRRPPPVVVVSLLTRGRFVGGRLYAWQPGTSHLFQTPEAARDQAAFVSSFRVPVEPWMQGGFHFKFIDARGQFEEERHNRVWRPGDGPVVYVKSGQVSVRTKPLALQVLDVALVLPRALAKAPPPLRLRDDSEGGEASIAADPDARAAPDDTRFVVAHYRPAVFPRTPYTVCFGDTRLGGTLIVRPVRVAEDDAGADLSMMAVYGDDRWLRV